MESMTEHSSRSASCFCTVVDIVVWVLFFGGVVVFAGVFIFVPGVGVVLCWGS